jgi:hypothetical protein
LASQTQDVIFKYNKKQIKVMVKIGDKIAVKDKDLKGRTFTVISTDGKLAYIQDVQTWERWTVSVKIIR